MTNVRNLLLGAAMVLCGVGAASAQGYDQDQQVTYDRDGTETIIVRPDHDFIEKHQTIGRVDGEINPTAYTISRPVSLADLDMSQPEDRQEMRNRVYEAAVDLCYQLDDRVSGLRSDESADKECVRTATRDAIRDVRDQRWRD